MDEFMLDKCLGIFYHKGGSLGDESLLSRAQTSAIAIKYLPDVNININPYRWERRKK